MRPLRDRVAEAMRRSRIGTAKPDYHDLPEHTKEDYRRSADALLSIGREKFGFAISDMFTEAGE